MVSPAHTSQPQAPVALTIAGSDSGANAGIQADLLTFAANQVYGTSVVTCLTAQNPNGVASIASTHPDQIAAQANAVINYYNVAAAKTGMLFSQKIIECVADFFTKCPDIQLVVDPIMIASSGKPLLEDSAITSLQERLLPLATVITPNLDEAEILYGEKLTTPEQMATAAEALSEKWNATVLIKGGHLEGILLHDVVCEVSGKTHTFTQERIQSIDTHGSGCTLSAAITAQLAKCEDPLSAVSIARNYLRRGMEDPVHLSGNRFINHFPR